MPRKEEYVVLYTDAQNDEEWLMLVTDKEKGEDGPQLKPLTYPSAKAAREAIGNDSNEKGEQYIVAKITNKYIVDTTIKEVK